MLHTPGLQSKSTLKS